MVPSRGRWPTQGLMIETQQEARRTVPANPRLYSNTRLVPAWEGGGVAQNSSIEWTEATWNPTTGCDRTSPGCDHCYALTLAKRLKAMGVEKYQHDGDDRTSGPGFRLTTHSG